MILRNPTDNEVSAQIKGNSFSIPAGGELELRDDYALEWKKNIHQFLEIVPGSETSAPQAEPETEELDDEDEELEPEVPAPVVDELE